MGLWSRITQAVQDWWQSKPTETVRHQVEDVVEDAVQQVGKQVVEEIVAPVMQPMLAFAYAEWVQERDRLLAQVNKGAMTAEQAIRGADAWLAQKCGQ